MARVRLFGILAILFGLLAGIAAQTGVAQDTPMAPSTGEAALPGGTLPGNPEIQAVQVATGLVDPVNVSNAGDGTNRLFIVERVGYVRILTPEGEVLEEPFLDLFNSVKTDFLEQGLLGLAFHPDYANNGRFFVYYSDYVTNGAHTLAEYTVSADDPNVADPTSARILFQIPDPYFNHNGGTIAFGPDGMLYVSIGDGGSAGDPYDNALDLSKLHGKILRLDVDNGDVPYGIPDDNPFADAGRPLTGAEYDEPGRYHPDGAPEIFVYGLRNAWQFSFDPETGDMYIADVGQGMWEEINVVPAGTSGQNFGWDYLEGTHCYPADVSECVAYGTLPVAEYSHEDGSCSITGIGVSRSETAPSLTGVYLAGDYCSGKIWGLAMDGGTWQFQELLDTSLLITGAGVGEDGALYITTCECAFGKDYDPFESSNGTLWRIVEASSVTGDDVTAPVDTPDAAATPEA